MDNLNNIIKKNNVIIQYFLIVCIIISGINCIKKSDSNIFLFLFLYAIIIPQNIQINEKNIKNERLSLAVIFILSEIVDFIWVLEFRKMNYGLSYILSWLEIFIKIPIIIIIFLISLSENVKKNGFNELNEDL
jgi:hypothetical protein